MDFSASTMSHHDDATIAALIGSRVLQQHIVTMSLSRSKRYVKPGRRAFAQLAHRQTDTKRSREVAVHRARCAAVGNCWCVLGPVNPPSTASFYLSRLIFGADRHGARFPHQLKNELTREPHAIGAWPGPSPRDGLPVVTASGSSSTLPTDIHFSAYWQLTYSAWTSSPS